MAGMPGFQGGNAAVRCRQRGGPGVRSDAAADSGPAAECSSTGASMGAPALWSGCCCTRGDRPAERATAPSGAGMLIDAVRLLVGGFGAGPRPHLVKSYLSDTFMHRGETIKGGAAPPFTPKI